MASSPTLDKKRKIYSDRDKDKEGEGGKKKKIELLAEDTDYIVTSAKEERKTEKIDVWLKPPVEKKGSRYY